MSAAVATGEPRRPELVLLHGWGLSSAVWQPLLSELEARYRLTLIDLPGMGSAPALEQTNIDTMVDALLAQAPPRAIWLGWSLGGTLAMAVAAQAPQRVAGLLLVAATPCFVQREDWSQAMAANTFAAFRAALAQDSSKTLNRFATLQTRGSTAARTELGLLKRVIAESRAATGGLIATLDLLAQDLRPRMKRLSLPMMLILGVQDQLVPVAMAEALRTLNPGLELKRYERAAHLPFLTEPERFLADLGQLAARCQEIDR